MAEYWGARAIYSSGGPNGEGTRYHQPESNPNLSFTPPAGDGGATIEVVYQQLMGQHPEDISALADQWHNAYALLASIREQLLTQSRTLYDETWKSAEARDAFMKMGPGTTLAYLDEWMDAALNNETALRAQVGIARQSRTDVENLWNEYEAAIDDAKTASGGTAFMEGFKTGITLGIYDGDAGLKAAESEAVNETQQEYNRKAQQLAYRVAGEYFDTFSKMSGGHGPPFMPPNAVMNVVGHPPWRTPGGGPNLGAPPPPGVPRITVTPPVAPPAPVVPTALTNNPTRPAPPRAPDPSRVTDPRAVPTRPDVGRPVAPVMPAVSPPVAPNRTPPAMPALRPPAAPGLPNGPSGNPGGNPGQLPGSGPAPGTAPAGVPRPGAAPPALPPNPASMRNGVLQGRGPGGIPQPPAQPALTSPAARTPGAVPPGGRLPGRGGGAQDGTQLRQQPGRDSPFGRPPAGLAPPVLRQTPTAQPTRGDRIGGPNTPARPGTTPPVLGRPAAGATPPPATGDRRKATARDRRRSNPDAQWVGTEEARADTSAPVLDAPALPPSGSAVSRLEEVPSSLRRAPTGSAFPAGGNRGGTVPPELATRRTSADGQPVDAARAPAAGADGERRILTDEDVFVVETPGGGVLGKGREDTTTYRAEPKTALGGG
ncbi:hypothetical protein [Polymorphospora sp. NPDC050346]|uniref:hypothetical protein n=1 Tax=Polymorphospora sp. NPDC050346 TaxID=3155780 RepID=UPI0033F08E10